MKKYLLCLVSALLTIGVSAQQNPKKEFRGAWMHTVHQGQYKEKSSAELKKYLIDQLDKLQAAGVNAVLFQVRPSADSFYPSELEPWSRFLTDNGKAPEPYWDPLQFMIDESHKRGMELHAWLNPYRVTTSKNEKLAPGHLFYKEPQRFVDYADGKKYFDPGLPENRKFITDVVVDIISRYDVDGIHFDDYFYPYPVAGSEFPDDASYAKYGNGMSRDDWRRKNVDLLIEDIHEAIVASPKPWVRFGISPFGIWRNKASDPRGSNTNGLQNYDALYADVLLWDEKGWIDYLLPQLYWELEHKRASAIELNRWWNDVGLKHHLYIGQDVNNIMTHADLAPSTNSNQLGHKIKISRDYPNIQGNCWWSGYVVTDNFKGVADSLAQNYQNTIALVPEYGWIKSSKPGKIGKPSYDTKTKLLSWPKARTEGKTDDVNHYVVYRFELDDTVMNPENAENIYAVTYDNNIKVEKPGKYMVSGLNRVNREGAPSEVITINL